MVRSRGVGSAPGVLEFGVRFSSRFWFDKKIIYNKILRNSMAFNSNINIS